MIYIISARAYWRYVNEFGMTHGEIMAHVGRAFGIRGTITELHIVKDDDGE